MFLKILKTFNEIVLAFLSVESKINVLYVNINFTRNLLLEFGRYWGKVLTEATVFIFLSACTHKCFFNIFFTLTVVNNSRNKTVSAFLLYFIGFDIINFYNFYKNELFWIKLILLKIKNY